MVAFLFLCLTPFALRRERAFAENAVYEMVYVDDVIEAEQYEIACDNGSVKAEGLTADEVDTILNKKSGLFGISGISSDCRDVSIAADEGNPRAQLALKILVHNIKKIIGSYVAEMNGVDALVFTAGIGENDGPIRAAVCKEMSFLGIEMDEEVNANTQRGTLADLSKAGAKVKTFVIPTDEEYMIALDTKNLTK